MIIRPVAIGLIVFCLAACATTTAPSNLTPRPGVGTPFATAPVLPASPPAPLATPSGDRRGWPACAALAGQAIELPRDFAPRFPFPADIHLIRFSTETNGTYTQQRIVAITPFDLP